MPKLARFYLPYWYAFTMAALLLSTFGAVIVAVRQEASSFVVGAIAGIAFLLIGFTTSEMRARELSKKEGAA